MSKRYYSDKAGVMKRSSGMIHEDRSKPCLLPTEIIDKVWPDSANYHMKFTDTLFNGVSNQLRQDSADFGKAFSPKKY
jgi:hypothetical protein